MQSAAEMFRKLYIGIAGLCLLISVMNCSNSEETCTAVVSPIPTGACYVHESKVSTLTTQMLAVLGMLNNEQDFADSSKVQLRSLPNLHRYEMCCEERLQLLAQELLRVTRQQWELLVALQVPPEARVKALVQRKYDLILRLYTLRVFTGNASPEGSMLLETFDNQVEYLDYGFDVALTALLNEPPTSPVLPARLKLRQSILDPGKSKSELLQVSRNQPTAMSEALPQLISNRYAWRLENVQLVLDFIKDLPKVVHRMIGYTSLYDAMSANADLESYEVTKLVLQLQGLNASVTSATDAIPRSVLTRYLQLVEAVWPVYKLVGRSTTCDYRNVGYDRSLSGRGNVLHLYSVESSRMHWLVNAVPGTAMFTVPGNQWYSSESDVFSASKRNVKYRIATSPDLFSQWKLVPVKGGKYFRILNAKYDEVLFADNIGRLFLTRHDYPQPHDYEQNADLWTIDCK